MYIIEINDTHKIVLRNEHPVNNYEKTYVYLESDKISNLLGEEDLRFIFKSIDLNLHKNSIFEFEEKNLYTFLNLTNPYRCLFLSSDNKNLYITNENGELKDAITLEKDKIVIKKTDDLESVNTKVNYSNFTTYMEYSLCKND